MKSILCACDTLAVACGAAGFTTSAFALHQPGYKPQDTRTNITQRADSSRSHIAFPGPEDRRTAPMTDLSSA